MSLINARQINRRDDIPDILVSQSTQDVTISHKKLEPVVLRKDILTSYEKALSKEESLGSRLVSFLSATNKAGRKAKVVKDFLLIFLPYGKQISNVTELITEQYITPMAKSNNSPDKKPALRSKSIIVFSLLLIVSVLQHFGVDLGLELSPDAAWLGTATAVIGILLRLATGKPVDITKLLKP